MVIAKELCNFLIERGHRQTPCREGARYGAQFQLGEAIADHIVGPGRPRALSYIGGEMRYYRR